MIGIGDKKKQGKNGPRTQSGIFPLIGAPTISCLQCTCRAAMQRPVRESHMRVAQSKPALPISAPSIC